MSISYDQAPERLDVWHSKIQNLIDTKGITAFAIDESHCISEWVGVQILITLCFMLRVWCKMSLHAMS